MPTIADALALAVQYHQAGDLVQAEQIYRQILQANPAEGNALRLLGVLAHEVGQHQAALALLQQAVAILPHAGVCHASLAAVYVALGRWDEAEASCREALRYQPESPEAHNNLGNVLNQRGRPQEAVASFREALRWRPGYAEAQNNLGLALAGQGQVEEAMACYREVLRIRPDLPEPHFNLGNAFRTQGRSAEAIARLEQAVRLRPDYAEAHYNLGSALAEQGRLAEAVRSYREALRCQPDSPEAHYNLGNVLNQMGNVQDAAASFGEALRWRPGYVGAHNNLGLALAAQGQFAEAMVCYREALRHEPDLAEAHYNVGNALIQMGNVQEAETCYLEALRHGPDLPGAHLGLSTLWLLLGNFEQGWPEYEWRWQMKDFPSSPRSQPKWDGRLLDGKTILLHAEQGLGDTLQFIRYAAVVKQRGGTVVAECQPSLLGVLAGCPGIDQLVREGEPLPACDVQAPLLSLPGLCGTALATIPAEVPYLVAYRSRVEHWRDRLAAVSGFKVGICWQGYPGHKNDRRRSVPLEQFVPLAEVPGLRLVSLQKGPGSEQWTALAGHWPVAGLPGQAEEPSEGWVDTAALVCALDLVITVDTAVAHLAGALGVPVWVALPFSPDWRWLLGRADSPWYPTMRLFRQTRLGHWSDVFERIAAELQRAKAEKRANNN